MGKFCIVGGRPVNKGVGMLQMSRAKRSAQRRPSKPWRCCWRCCRTLSQKFGSVSWLWLLRFNESTLAGSRRSTMARKGPETAFWEITPGEGRNLATVSFSLKDIFVESELTADTACVKSAKSIGVRSGQLAHPPAGVGAPERAGHRDDQGRRDRDRDLTADTACVKSAKSIGVRSGQLAHPPAGVGAPERAGHRDDQGRRD